MTNLVIVVLVFGWLLCGFIAAGWSFAYLQRHYRSLRKEEFKRDVWKSLVDVLFGGIALVYALVFKTWRSHGWLNPYGKKAKQEAGLISS